jgi:hypothetical protein
VMHPQSATHSARRATNCSETSQDVAHHKTPGSQAVTEFVAQRRARRAQTSHDDPLGGSRVEGPVLEIKFCMILPLSVLLPSPSDSQRITT